MNKLKEFLIKKIKENKVKSAILNNFSSVKIDSSLLQDIIYLHCVTNGFKTEEFSHMLKSSMKYNLDGLKSIFDKSVWDKKDEMINSLRQDGYCILPQKLSDEHCKKIVNMALSQKYIPRAFKNNAFQETSIKSPYLSARYDLGSVKTLEIPFFQELICEPLFIQMATEYLYRPPFLDPIEFWCSVPFTQADEQFALDYHFDMDSLKWFKVFINFEDITIKNGPHSYIKGSHLPGKLSNKIRSKFYSRISDEDIYENFEREKEVIFTVPKGTILIEDTKGMHKGYHVEEGRRFLLSFQYSNILLSNNSISANYPIEKHLNFDFMLKKNPSFFYKYYDVQKS
jgi:Phytanoyl-CoA dioxygenase (PhyH)